MGITIVMEHVRTADTTYRMDNKVLVNIDIFGAYLEQYRILGD